MYINTYDTYTIEQININLPNQLIMSESFNEHIENLPLCVEKLIFGLGYKKKINYSSYDFENIITNENLFNDFDSFSKFNNNSINNLPNTVKWIIFPCDSTFNTELKTLPECLELLSLGKNYTKNLNNLPNGLKYFFYFIQDFYSSKSNFYSNIKSIPDTINFIGIITNTSKSLEIVHKQTKLLKICSFDIDKTTICNIGNVDNLVVNIPENVEKLFLNCYYYSEIKFLPNRLKKLKITQLNSLDILTKLPDSLEELDVGFKNITNSNNINTSLPCGLKKLFIDYFCVEKIHKTTFINLGSLPDSLELLSIKSNLKNVNLDDLPSGLKYLKLESILSESDKDDIDIFSNLPRRLEKLLIIIVPQYNSKYTKPTIKLKNLPDSLGELIIFSKLNYKLDKEYLNIQIHKFEENYINFNIDYDKKKYFQFVSSFS